MSVSDDGPGIAPELEERIFEPFFTTKFKGRGLGLAAVRGIILGHEGQVDVYRRPEGGTRFRVQLPCAREEAPTPPNSKPNAEVVPMSGRVLVIDDDEAVLRVTCSMLEALGFEVLEARSGEQGIDLYQRHGPEIRCSLVDLTMPGCSGLEVVETLRGIDPEARLILMSGHASEVVTTLRQWGEETTFLKKPFSWNELAGRLERTLRRSRARETLAQLRQRSSST